MLGLCVMMATSHLKTLGNLYLEKSTQHYGKNQHQSYFYLESVYRRQLFDIFLYISDPTLVPRAASWLTDLGRAIEGHI